MADKSEGGKVNRKADKCCAWDKGCSEIFHKGSKSLDLVQNLVAHIATGWIVLAKWYVMSRSRRAEWRPMYTKRYKA